MAFSSKLAALAVALASLIVVEQCAAQNTPQDFVNLHNAARAEVGVDPVSWDDNVAAYASRYAQERQGDCAIMHSPTPRPYGENIYSGWGSSPVSASDAMAYWVNEKQYYDHGSNSCAQGRECKHYTQIVWRNTKAIGCARVVCNNSSGVFIICSYSPPGNIRGQSPY